MICVQRALKKYLIAEGEHESKLRGPHLATMLRNHHDFKDSRAKLEQIIRDDFARSVQAAQFLEGIAD